MMHHARAHGGDPRSQTRDDDQLTLCGRYVPKWAVMEFRDEVDCELCLRSFRAGSGSASRVRKTRDGAS